MFNKSSTVNTMPVFVKVCNCFISSDFWYYVGVPYFQFDLDLNTRGHYISTFSVLGCRFLLQMGLTFEISHLQ